MYMKNLPRVVGVVVEEEEEKKKKKKKKEDFISRLSTLSTGSSVVTYSCN